MAKNFEYNGIVLDVVKEGAGCNGNHVLNNTSLKSME